MNCAKGYLVAPIVVWTRSSPSSRRIAGQGMTITRDALDLQLEYISILDIGKSILGVGRGRETELSGVSTQRGIEGHVKCWSRQIVGA